MDYCSNIYHPMLTMTQSDQLKKIQHDIYKIIFGFERSYASILEEENLDRLSERRQKLFDDFTLKASNSERYSSRWFPTKTFEHADLRKERIYVEKYARTDRLRFSPLYTMRRRLNKISPVTFVN